jgi:nucleoside-diphosphate-sugar epimerase
MTSSQMRIAVTGGNGFVGSCVVRSLQTKGHSVVGLGRTGTKNPNVEFIRCDLSKDNLDHFLRDVDAIVHCAGQAHASGATEADYRMNIVTATSRLIEALARPSRNITFVNLSSIKAMGETLALSSDESTPCTPSTIYGQAKLTAEDLVSEAASAIGTAVTLRPSPVFGPNGKGIIGLLSSLGQRGLLPKVSARTGVRSYVHVDDLTSAILVSLQRPRGHHTYCVGDGRAYTIADVQALVNQRRFWSSALPPVSDSLLKVAQLGPWGKRLRLQDRLLADCHVSPALLVRETGWAPAHHLGISSATK